MAVFNKVNSFIEYLAEAGFNLGSDQLKIALTNTSHVSTWDRLSNLTEISYTNLSSRNITTSASLQTSGVYKLTLADLVLTASGAVGPFRYIYIYDDTSTNDLLIGYYDHGSSISLANGQTYTIDFDGSNGVLQLV